jgi:tRNA pseudouridine13 synthase
VLEDFVVEELPLYAPSGEGAHTFLLVEKRGRTTEEVARALARAAGVSARDVGYAGRKDRWAVARQWFSAPGLDPARAVDLPLPDARVLEARRHRHRLRTGQLMGNRFRIRVRGVGPALAERAVARLAEMERQGMPNAFGVQRFGRDGDNAPRGRDLLLGGAGASDRRAARFLVSAFQAAVFNAFLARRPIPLDAVEEGEVAQVCASGGLFVVEDVERELARARSFEISATGPIFGARTKAPRGAAAEREREALVACGVDDPAALRAPRGLRLRGARRPVRVRPCVEAASAEGDDLRLDFVLPSGSYATVLLEEALGERPQEGGADPAAFGELAFGLP